MIVTRAHSGSVAFTMGMARVWGQAIFAKKLAYLSLFKLPLKLQRTCRAIVAKIIRWAARTIWCCEMIKARADARWSVACTMPVACIWCQTNWKDKMSSADCIAKYFTYRLCSCRHNNRRYKSNNQEPRIDYSTSIGHYYRSHHVRCMYQTPNNLQNNKV